jgi:hypothetical protein
VRFAVALAALLIARASGAAESKIPRVAIEASADHRLSAADVAEALGEAPAFPLAIRLQVDVADASAVRDLDATIAAYEARRVKLWLAMSIPASERDATAWREALQRWLRAHQGNIAIVELRLPSEAQEAAIAEPIRAKYAEEGSPYYGTARLWDDGVLDPVDTRAAIGLCLAASLNAPLPETRFPVFRM